MQKAINRFWDWLFHPSVRLYQNKNLKASVYRYPSPANNRDENLAGSWYQDYKTPYEHSRYNVRYAKPTPAQTAEPIYTVSHDSPALTAEHKQPTKRVRLKKTGLLKDGDEHNVDLLAQAKKKYQQRFGKPVQQTIYSNDLDVKLPKSINRAELAAYIQSHYQEFKEIKKNAYDYSRDRKTIDDPEIMPLESVDMFVSPHFQQSRIVNEYLIQREINENLKKKSINAHVGDARFWKAIDDSFETSEIVKVQKHVGDPEPTQFELRSSKVELQVDAEGKVVTVHPKH